MTNGQVLAISIIICFIMRMVGKKDRQKLATSSNSNKITVEVTITDELTKEKLRNLYEEQDICNQKICNIQCKNRIIEDKREDIKRQIKLNEEYASLQMQQNGCNVALIQETLNASNRSLIEDKNKLDAELLTNRSKIVQLNKRTNKITEEVYKIGEDAYYGRA